MVQDEVEAGMSQEEKDFKPNGEFMVGLSVTKLMVKNDCNLSLHKLERLCRCRAAR